MKKERRGGAVAAAVVVLLGGWAQAARADEGRRVRLELKDGTVVEGRLAEFASRTYAVRRADGSIVRVGERDVAQLRFLAEPEGPPPPASAVAAEVVAAAARSGALDRVLGQRHYLFRDHAQPRPGFRDPDEPPPEPFEYLVAVTVTREEPTPRLSVELEVIVPPGSRRDPELLNTDQQGRPARYRLTLDAGGRLERGDLFWEGAHLVWQPEGDRLVLRGFQKGKRGERDWRWSDELLPEPLVVFALGPLHDQGLPPGFGFRLLHRKPDGPTILRRLHVRPELEARGGEPVRVVEMAAERAGETLKNTVRLCLAAEGPLRAELVRYETERWGTYDDVPYVTETTVGERIPAERFEALVRAWGAARAPARPPAPPPEEVGEPTRDAVADLLVRARAAGALARLEGERWFWVRPPQAEAEMYRRLLEEHPDLPETQPVLVEKAADAAAAAAARRLVRVTGALTDAGGFTFEVESTTLGDPQATDLQRYVWDASGVLVRTHGESPRLDGGRLTVRGERRGDRLHVLEEERHGGRVTETERDTAKLHEGSVPEVFAWYALPLLADLLPRRLEVSSVLNPKGGRRSADLLRYPLGPEVEALELGPDPDGFGDATWPLPAPRPDEAFVLAWRGEPGQRPRPIGLVWLREGSMQSLVTGGDGSLDPRSPERWTRLEPVGPDEVARLRADAEATAAGARLRRRANETWVGVVLFDLTSKVAAFQSSDLDRDGAPDYPEGLEELTAAGLAEPPLSLGEVCGYRITLGRAADAPGERWIAVANPVRPGVDGDRSFAVTQEGAILRADHPLTVPADARPPETATPDPHLAELGR